MQILRSFSIIAAVVLIIASSNISFKLGHNDVSARINGEAPLIDNAFLSIDGQSIFSSLLQTINAQEQEEKIGQEENGKDSDAVMDKEEEQDEEEEEGGGGDSEKESSIEQEQDGSEVQQKQDEIKVDCAQGEHFDSELNSCIPDKEKVCDDDRDNDNDGRVDSVDSDCLHNKNEQEQQNNGNEQENKEKLPAVEEQSLNKKEENKGEENPVSIVEQQQQQQNNNDISSDSYEAEDRAQNSTQNLTDRHTIATTGTTITTNDNASLNEFHYPANASAAVQDNGYTLKCDPEGAEMLPGEEDSITCTIENKTPKPIELALVCSGLDGTGIECRINGEYPIGKTLVKEMSYTNFSVLLVSRSSPSVPAGSYPFSISSEECINSGLC